LVHHLCGILHSLGNPWRSLSLSLFTAGHGIIVYNICLKWYLSHF
jgi:hypothetical protein